MSPFLLLGLLSLGFFAVTLDSTADDLADDEETGGTETEFLQNTDTNSGSDTDDDEESDAPTSDDKTDEEDEADTSEPDEDGDTDAAEDDEEEEDDTLVNGTAGSDTLSGGLSQVVNGLAGNDVLNADATASGATLNGGAGDDTISSQGSTTAVNGGEGDDEITTTATPDGILNGDAGNDTFNLDGPGLVANGGEGDDVFDALVDSQDMVLNGDEGNDTITALGQGGAIDGGDGDDNISIVGAIGSVLGGFGDDEITATDGVNGGGATIDAGAGDDIIQLVGSATGVSHVAVTASGGFNDDTFDTQTELLFDRSDDVTDVFTGGDGADTFDLSFFVPEGAEFAEGGDAGVVTRVTDFVMGEDVLIIDETIRDLAGESLGFELDDDITLERPDDEDYTDVILSYSNAADETMTVTIRLEGVDETFSEDEITFA